MKRCRLYSYLLLTLAAPLFCFAQGLRFAGLECPIDKRTSLDVFSSGRPAFSDHFSISFEFEMFPASEIGYIFRMKSAEDDKVYNLFYDGKGENHLFRLNEEGRYSLIKAEIPRDRMPERWTEMDIYLDLKRDSLYMTIAGERFAASCQLPDRYTPTINFGKSEHLIDVPSFAIRDLRVESRSRKYYFPLNERYGNTASDSDYRMRGTVTNPEWLINDSYQWTQLASMSLDTVATAVYSCKNRSFYYFTKDTVYTYDPLSETVGVRKFPTPCPVTMKLGMSLADVEGGDAIYVYEPYGNEAATPVSVASLNPETLEWSILSTDRIDMQVHHHAPFRTGIEGMPFAFFGGFGNQKYNGSFYGFDINCGRWVDMTESVEDIPVICPRYFTSAGRDEKTGDVYIFGGMGNESGEQVVGRRYLYDLYRVNLEKGIVEKLWEIKWDGENMVPVRNMVVTDPEHFLVLCYPESVSNSQIKLYRFSILDGTFQALATEIPIRSDRISTNANLYFDSQLERLYAAVQEYDDYDVKSTLKIYSLAYPPLTEEELISYSGIDTGGGIITACMSPDWSDCRYPCCCNCLYQKERC